MKSKTILAIITTLGLCAGAASAKGTGKHEGDYFAKLDTNSDGLISLDEFTAKAKDSAKAKEIFAKADTNKDGSLDKTEFAALAKHHQGHHKHAK